MFANVPPCPSSPHTRERRLWAYALVVVFAIYSTLGLARTLAEQLGDAGLGVWLFLIACIMVLVAVVTQGLTTRPSVAEWGVAMGIAAAYLLVFVRMAIPTERSHLIEYGVVAVCIYEALRERAGQGRRVPVPVLLTVLLTGLLGVLDEFLQILVPRPDVRPGGHVVQCAGRRDGGHRIRRARRGETVDIDSASPFRQSGHALSFSAATILVTSRCQSSPYCSASRFRARSLPLDRSRAISSGERSSSDTSRGPAAVTRNLRNVTGPS